MHFATDIIVNGARHKIRWASRLQDGRAWLQIGTEQVEITNYRQAPEATVDRLLAVFTRELCRCCETNSATLACVDPRLVRGLAYVPIVALCRDPGGAQEETGAITGCYDWTTINLDDNTYQYEYTHHPLTELFDDDWLGLELPV